jgi:hypothetical protein
MKNAKWVRLAAAAATAGALVAASSTASAQYGDPQECETQAWAACNPAPGPWTPWHFQCWNDTYDACMNGYAKLEVKQPVSGDKARDVQLASRSTAGARLR